MKKILCKHRVEASSTTAYCMAGHFPIDCGRCNHPDKSYIDIETTTTPMGKEDNSCILLYGLDGRQCKQTPDEIQKVINEEFFNMI